MTYKDINATTAIVVTPYNGWIDLFWPKGLIRDVTGFEVGLTLLDWTLAGIDRSLIKNIVLICHSTQYETLSRHLGTVRILPCENSEITGLMMDVFSESSSDILFIYPWVVFHEEFCRQFMGIAESDVLLASNDFGLLNSDESYRHQVTMEKMQLHGEQVITCGRLLDKENWHAS